MINAISDVLLWIGGSAIYDMIFFKPLTLKEMSYSSELVICIILKELNGLEGQLRN